MSEETGPDISLAGLAAERGVPLSPTQEDQFQRYQRLLQTWNRKLNLTRIQEPRDIKIRHFLDALLCAPVTGNLNGQTLIDVGTGAGLPGLPLKILYPEMHLTLVDSVAKKTRFLTAVVEELGLTDVTVLAERAETLGQNPHFRERFDWAVARSVADMRVLAEYLLPLVRVGGHMLAQKGDHAREETEVATAAINLLGGGLPTFTAVQLPEHARQHFLVLIEKRSSTPAKYPRRPGKPTKSPL